MDKREIALLVERSLQGDTYAFGELYKLTEKQAYYIALRIAKNEDDALDILQDCYIKAMQKMNTLENPENFVAWFNQIVANTTKNFVTRNKPMLFRDDDDEAAVMDLQVDDTLNVKPDDSLDTAETREFIRELVDELPEDKRMCVLMYYFQNMSTAQIAETLGISEGTVKTRLYHSRDKIKQSIEALEKKGVKVRGIAPIPFFIWMLKRMADGTRVSYATSAAIVKAATSSAAAGATAAAATTAAATTSATVASGVAATATTAATATATTAATAAGSAAATGVAAKIIAIAVAGAMVVGGGAVGVKVALDKRAEENRAVQVEDSADDIAVEDDVTEITLPANPTKTGYCGEDVVWSFYEATGELYITGTGAMWDRDYEPTPWSSEGLNDDIKSVKIGNSVTTIDDGAFRGCQNLTDVTIGNSVKIIYSYVFSGCSKLTNVTIPDSVTTIGESAFNKCYNLVSITVDANNKNYSSDSYGVLFDKGKTTLIQYPIGNSRESYTIPDSVTTIREQAFDKCSSLARVTMGNGVATIEKWAFRACPNLKNITIPYGAEVSSDAFEFTDVTITYR